MGGRIWWEGQVRPRAIDRTVCYHITSLRSNSSFGNTWIAEVSDFSADFQLLASLEAVLD